MYFDVKSKQVFATTGGKAFDNSKPTVIFLHGSGFDHTVWSLQSRFFAYRKYAVLAPDLPWTHQLRRDLRLSRSSPWRIGWTKLVESARCRGHIDRRAFARMPYRARIRLTLPRPIAFGDLYYQWTGDAGERISA